MPTKKSPQRPVKKDKAPTKAKKTAGLSAPTEKEREAWAKEAKAYMKKHGLKSIEEFEASLPKR